MPLAPRAARAIDLAIGERLDGPIFIDAAGSDSIDTRLAGLCAVSHGGPGSPSGSGPTRCVTPSSPRRSTLAYRSVTCRKPPATPIHGPRCATTEAASPSTATPPTSSPPSSLAHPADTAVERSVRSPGAPTTAGTWRITVVLARRDAGSTSSPAGSQESTRATAAAFLCPCYAPIRPRTSPVTEQSGVPSASALSGDRWNAAEPAEDAPRATTGRGYRIGAAGVRCTADHY